MAGTLRTAGTGAAAAGGDARHIEGNQHALRVGAAHDETGMIGQPFCAGTRQRDVANGSQDALDQAVTEPALARHLLHPLGLGQFKRFRHPDDQRHVFGAGAPPALVAAARLLGPERRPAP